MTALEQDWKAGGHFGYLPLYPPRLGLSSFEKEVKAQSLLNVIGSTMPSLVNHTHRSVITLRQDTDGTAEARNLPETRGLNRGLSTE